jgi:hypothetical protein
MSCTSLEYLFELSKYFDAPVKLSGSSDLFLFLGEPASLRNREKRGMTVLCSEIAALKQDCLP